MFRQSISVKVTVTTKAPRREPASFVSEIFNSRGQLYQINTDGGADVGKADRPGCDGCRKDL